jgi:tellurite resistance protein
MLYRSGALNLFKRKYFPMFEDVKEQLQLTDQDIQALADGQCSEESRRAIMATIMSSPRMMARLDEILQQNQMLKDWWSCIFEQN